MSWSRKAGARSTGRIEIDTEAQHMKEDILQYGTEKASNSLKRIHYAYIA
jgi:hypothetical protein